MSKQFKLIIMIQVIAVMTMLGVATSTHASKAYTADCTEVIYETKEIEIILSIRNGQFSLIKNGHYMWCVHIDYYEDVFFYQCGKENYNVTFREGMTKLIFAGIPFDCVFRDNEIYKPKGEL